MRRPILIFAALFAVLSAAFVAPGASAKRQVLMPGVTYEKQVQFTMHGPVVVHVLTAPRPGGLYSLQPALSNEAIPGTETLSAIQRRLSTGATTAGVSGDTFAADGRPSGILMRDGTLDHRPLSTRSSIGIDFAGALHVDRVTLLGTVQGSGERRKFSLVDEPAPANGFALFTPVWGAATPATPGSFEIVLRPFPRATTNTELRGPVVQAASGGGTAIPPDGVVVIARGTAAERQQAEAPVGQSVAVRLVLSPSWAGMVGAVGGGPVLVRKGRPVFRPAEAFSTDLLALRQPRAAVGQLADGRMVLVAVDGGWPGFSTGLTNYELAQTLVRLGAVTGAALGAGAQTGLAVDGKLATRPPAKGGEQPISDALLVSYAGVYAPEPTEPVLSPNGDNVGEVESLAYKVVRPSTVTAQLLGPAGAVVPIFSGLAQPGTYPFTWNGTTPEGAAYPEGRWRLVANATDDLGRVSTIERAFSLNLTLCCARTIGPALRVPRAAKRGVAQFTLAHPAATSARIETSSGVVLRKLGRSPRAAAGGIAVGWDGRTDSGALVYSGRYRVRITAQNELGSVSLTAPFTVRRVARAR